MAMELPLYNPPSGALLDDEAFLQQLLGPEDDLLTSLLESANANGAGTTEPSLNFDFDILNVPTSPLTSDVSTGNSPSYTNQANSPASLTSGSDGLGYSPVTSSPSPYMMQPFSSSMGMSEPTLDDLMTGVDQLSGGSNKADLTSSEIKIDVDYMTTTPELDRRQEEASPDWSVSDMKAHTLLLTEEEKKLLVEEGISLPTDVPLTKAEQKHLKRVRRKIKNKISAQESRKRKKEYVDGLEDRVKICTGRNRELKREVDCLKQKNVSLMAQLRKFQALVAQYNPSKVQAGSVLLVIVMSFSLFFVPKFKHYGGPQAIGSMSRSSRTLLFTETDEFGNVIDPDNGLIISPVGGQSPNFPPPWVYQTPALFSTRPGLPDEFETLRKIKIHSSDVEQSETKSERLADNSFSEHNKKL